MNLTNYFDISRFWLLLKMELFKSRKAIVMTSVITFGLLLVSTLSDPLFEDGKIEQLNNYASALMVSGFILSSLAFNDLGNDLRRFNYLTLPVSTLERFISMWLLTCIGWLVAFTVAYSVYTWIEIPIARLVYNQMTFETFDPISGATFNIMKYYFVLQGIFLVGAAHFKGYVFPKTLFTLLLFGAICGGVIYLFIAGLLDANTECLSDVNSLEGTAVYSVWLVAKAVFWWLLAPLCWVITFFGLKEKEV